MVTKYSIEKPRLLYNVRKQVCGLALLLFTMMPSQSWADEAILSNFTRSIARVYSISKSCEKTIYPGPQEYIVLIAAYFVKLYPNGNVYWVTPNNVEKISDPITCIRLIQTKLIDYRNARNEYNNTYPDRNPPPILVAYQWDKGYVESQPEVPVKSYTPSVKQTAKEKFFLAPTAVQ